MHSHCSSHLISSHVMPSFSDLSELYWVGQRTSSDNVRWYQLVQSQLTLRDLLSRDTFSLMSLIYFFVSSTHSKHYINGINKALKSTCGDHNLCIINQSVSESINQLKLFEKSRNIRPIIYQIQAFKSLPAKDHAHWIGSLNKIRPTRLWICITTTAEKGNTEKHKQTA